MSKGYIKLWRKTIDSKIFADPELFKLWCLCLLKASHKKTFITVDGLKEPIEVLPGQFVTGRYSLHSEYYPKRKKNQKSPSTVWRWMEILENMQNLHIETNNKFSIVSIVNWSSYQGNCTQNAQQNEQQVNSRCTADEQQMNTNKNVENVKKKDIRPFSIEKRPPTPYQDMVAIYHEVLPELPAVRKLTDKRKSQARKIFNDEEIGCSLDKWRSYCQHVRESKFLMGQLRGKTWQADFEFITNGNKFVKIIEGHYH